MSEFEAQFRERTKRSCEIYEEARTLLPRGVAGNAKSMDPYPIYLQAASGSRVIDVDGNEYIDLVMGGGPNLLGHRPESVLDAVSQQMHRMTNPLIATELEVDLARKVNSFMPHMEMIRFTNTGSEATRTALRAARAYTGREKIAKFEGNYHGSDDYFLFSGLTQEFAGPDTAPMAVVDCAGIPSSLQDQVVILPYNDAESTRELLEAHADELAAVIMEPVAFSTGGGVPAEADFLQTVRNVTSENDIVLIFDEVVTGFRIARGGAAEYFGVTPDLSAIGKALGGGFPIGAFGGKREIMEVVLGGTRASPSERSIFHSGTFTGNPVSMAAALATLTELESDRVYTHIDSLGEQLRQGLRDVMAERSIAAQVTGIGSLYQVHFTDQPVRNRRDILRSDLARQTEFCFGLTVCGVMQPPHHPGVVSTAHTPDEIDQIVDTAATVAQQIFAV